MNDAPRILVADSEHVYRHSLRFLMEAAGYDVRVAADGDAAWRELTGFRPDVVLLDTGLRGLDAWTLIAGMRTRLDLAGIPVVALCPDERLEDRLRILGAGVADCLDKPFARSELMVRVANLVTVRSATRRLNRLPGLAALADADPGAEVTAALR